MSIDVPRLLPNGDTAISVDFGNRIDLVSECASSRIGCSLAGRALPDDYLKPYRPDRALMVHFDPLTSNYPQLCALLLESQKLWARCLPQNEDGRRRPVGHGGDFGEDLHLIAAHANLDPESFVSAHMAKV